MNREQLRAQIQTAADKFTDEVVGFFGEALAGLVKDLAVDVKDSKPTKVAGRGPGRPPKAAPKAAPAPKAAAKPAPKKAAPAPKKVAPKVSKAGRRSPDELDSVADKVVRLLASRDSGMRIEEINKVLGTSTRELMRPIKKLLSTKKIRKAGERRSTSYSAA